jgi:hypothetical protein
MLARYSVLCRLSFRAAFSVLVGLCFNSCMTGNVPTGTRITPDFFKYATIIKAPADGSPGGWRAVCIQARVGQRIAHAQGAHIETGTRCGLEFGTPIVTIQHGFIPLSMAQRISADVANNVAYKVLSQGRGVTAITFNQCGATNWSHSVPIVPWP